MKLKEFQALLDEQGKSIKAEGRDGKLIVTNNLIVIKAFSKDMPENFIEVSGSVEVHEGATLTVPALQSVSGWVEVHEGATLTVPALQSSGWVEVHEGATLTVPALQSAGRVDVHKGATLTVPALQSVSGWVEVHEGATLTVPALQSVSGWVEVHEGATLTVPALQSAGRVDVHKGATLTAHKSMREAWGKNNGDMHGNVLYCDGMYSLVKPPVSKAGLTMYAPGCVGAPYVVTNGEFWAHGNTFKTAVADMEAKRCAHIDLDKKLDEFCEKFKPRVEYPVADFYSWHGLLTGSCEAGRNMFASRHGINLDVDMMTVESFFELTANEWGGKTIRMAMERMKK